MDSPKLSKDDHVWALPSNLSATDLEKDYISVPLPKLGFKDRLIQIGQQAYILLCALPLNLNHDYSKGCNK